MAREENKGDIFFNIDSRLLIQLGEKLVTNRAIALAELVKNSYDEDATKVIIRMENIKKPGGIIIVEDNGSGMSLSTFKNTWMRVATIDKEKNPITKRYKRKKAGEKGIGRFACRRLSKKLIIKSVAETTDGVKEELNATFDWSTFTPGLDMDKIPVKYSTKIVGQETLTGTTLILEDTTESWDGRDVRRLRNELTELFSPITFRPERKLKKTPGEYDPGFHVKFDCSEFPGKEESLDKTFFKNAWAKLTGCIDEKGFATYEIRVINKILRKLEKTFKRDETFKYVRNVKLEIYIFSYRSDLFHSSEWSRNKSRVIGHERGGIKVYADNFRVFGYGEKSDDWLRLDYDRARSLVGLDEEVSGYIEDDKRPGLRLFRNHNLFGHVVFIRDDNPMLEITANRERLIGNESLEELRKFTRLGIDFATMLYANEIYKEREEERKRKKSEEEKRRMAEEEARKEAEEARKRAEELAKKAEERVIRAEEERKKAENERRKAEEERRRIEEEARKGGEETIWQKAEEALKKEKDSLRAEEVARKKEEEVKKIADKERKKAEEERKKADEEQRKAIKDELQRKRETYEMERSQLRVLASTGTLILIFSHELQALIEEMEEMIINFTSIIKKILGRDRENYNDALESFSKRTEMIKELASFLGLTIGRESRLEKKEWVLYPIVESVFRPFKWYLEEFGIEYYNSIPDNLRSPKMYRSELVSVLHNLMSNSIKAVKGESERRIEVTGFEKEEVLYIRFLDSGKGLNKNLREVVFNPFESYSEPDFTFGIGTGLGLKIVMDLVKSYNGDIQFIDAPDGWKTCIEITFSKR